MIELFGTTTAAGGAAIAVTSVAAEGSLTATAVFAVLVALGGGALLYLKQRIVNLERSKQADEADIRLLLSLVWQLAVHHPDPDCRRRIETDLRRLATRRTHP